MKKETKYKCLRTGLKSDSGNCVWEIGEWKKESSIAICEKGFHCSKTPMQALGYVKGEILAEVEVKGKSIIETDKECWEEMRLVKAYNWTKEDFERDETAISLEEGHYYPDSNYGEKLSIDICPNCFKNKLVPWLESQGAKMRKKEWWY